MQAKRGQNFQFWLRKGSLQTILLCIDGELQGEGSMAVAVGVCDMLPVTGDSQHKTCDMICDM